MAGTGDATNGFAIFIEQSHNHIQGVTTGGCVIYHGIFQAVPYTVIELGLILECLVGVVESLVVGIVAGLAVIGGYQMATAVTAAGEAALPG